MTKQAVGKKIIIFLKADGSTVCNALAMCLQLSLLSCHCSILKKYSEISYWPLTCYDKYIYIYIQTEMCLLLTAVSRTVTQLYTYDHLYVF